MKLVCYDTPRASLLYMNDHVDIHQLVGLARTGDADAFGQLYDLFVDAVYRFVYLRVGNRPDAEDLTEQTFMSMFTAIGRYVDDGLPFEAWMYRIARNKVIDHYRTRKTHVPLEEVAEVRDPGDSPEEAADREITKEAVMESVRTLPTSYQEILILKFIEDKTNEEISVVVEKPVAHIRVLQHRAIMALRKVMKI